MNISWSHSICFVIGIYQGSKYARDIQGSEHVHEYALG